MLSYKFIALCLEADSEVNKIYKIDIINRSTTKYYRACKRGTELVYNGIKIVRKDFDYRFLIWRFGIAKVGVNSFTSDWKYFLGTGDILLRISWVLMTQNIPRNLMWYQKC